MRRRQVSQLGSPARPRRVHALIVDWNREHLRAGIPKGNQSSEIAWVLHPNRLSRFQESACYKIKPLLNSGHNKNLIGSASYPAGGSEVTCDCRSQRFESAPIPPAQQEPRGATQTSICNPCPFANREKIQRWHIKPKWSV
jgi:hypothetical protein